MDYGLFDLLNLLGALGFFIYGMKVMSEGIQKVAGAKMRSILRSMTSNRYKGVFTGLTITSLVQSSSATTVLVVSFVNAGLLSLTESIGVIMGSNIGTTITAWLITIVGFKIKIVTYALPIIALGFPLMFFHKEKIKFWGEVLVGFAFLFMGLDFLKDSVPDLRTNTELLSFLSSYTDLGYLSILLFVAIGTILTVVVQSSSAAMALTLVMSNNGWIPFELAAAMVLGENIGTTITANLASIVGNVHSKRAALSHSIFNILGVIWILFLIYPALNLVDWYLVSSGGSSPFEDSTSIPIALSIFHSAFNILNTLLFIWFVNFIAKIVTKIIKTRGGDEFHLEYISTGMMTTAELSIEEARKETMRMGEITQKMSHHFSSLISEKKLKKQKKQIKKIREYEVITDQMHAEIASYLMKVSTSGTLGYQSMVGVSNLHSTIDDLERIADLFFQMSQDINRIIKNAKELKNKQIANLQEMMDLVDESLAIMMSNLNSTKGNTLEAALLKEQEINALRDRLRKELTKEIKKDKYDPQRDGWYKDLFHLCEKIGDHAISVSESLIGEKERELKEAHD